MHIQEGTTTTLTTCSKMTEEVDRRHGVNGNSGKALNDDATLHNSAPSGGRLKFFKDGKFILELVRGVAREGERAGWVSVPRKTFWPPAQPAPHPVPTALSLSDDNSSLHSSPWQRDHAWKQPAPRRHAAKRLAFYYCRPNTLPAAAIRAPARTKRRRPFDPTPHDLPNGLKRPLNGYRNGDADADRNSADAVDGDSKNSYDNKYFHMKLKKPSSYNRLRVYRKTRAAPRPGGLARAIERLRARAISLPAPVNAQLASCKQEHALVSPRKRILRELERVSLEESNKRRAKTAPALSTASYPPSPGPSQPPRPPSKHVSSYSIHSLLSMGEERSSPRPPSHRTESPASVHSPDLSPSPESYRYRYGALSLDSPGDSPTPPADVAARYRAGMAGAAPYAGRAFTPYPRRDDLAAYGYAGYGYGAAALYRAPALWLPYPPPGPWAPLPHPLITDHIPKEEPSSDVPLNLSKH